MLVPGTLWKEYHVEVGKIMTSRTIRFRFIRQSRCSKMKTLIGQLIKIFHAWNFAPFRFRYSRLWFITRAYANKYGFTVEPGIYIPEEGFGIRLEDDVVIQPSGAPFNLMKNIPIEADEIESIMNS